MASNQGTSISGLRAVLRSLSQRSLGTLLVVTLTSLMVAIVFGVSLGRDMERGPTMGLGLF